MRKVFVFMTLVALVVSLFSSTFTNTSLVSANTLERGVITASSLNIRESPSTSARVIGSLSRNAEIDLHERTGSWYKVRHNNRWGYIHSDYVQVKTASSNVSTGNTVIAKGEVTATRLNVRDKATTSSTVIGTLLRGNKLDLYEKSGQWYKVKINNRWGYIHGDFVKVSQVSQPSQNNNSSGTVTNQVIGTGEITATRLNIREQANTSSRIIGSLSLRQKVDVYERSGQWYRIKNGSSWGFIHGDFVTYTAASNSSGSNSSNNSSGSNVTSDLVGIGEITATRLNIRENTNTSSRIVGSLDRGAKVDLFERNGQWFRIKVGSGWGYIHSDYVKVTQVPPSSGNQTANPAPTNNEIIAKGEITATRLNVRQNTNTTSSIIGSLNRGTVVDLYEKVGTWYKIKQGTGWGYIHSDYIKLVTITDNSQGNTGNKSDINLSGKTIFLDPGHGGRDPGAVVNQIKESDLALSISNLLIQRLEAAGAKVVTSRTTDVFLPLGDRVSLANASNADIFISIHMNSWATSSAHGVEVYYNSVNAGVNSKKLADSIQSQMVSNFPLRDRGVREANFEVIRFTRMPAVLAELGFMTNSNDLTILVNEQEKIADVLLEAIGDYFK